MTNENNANLYTGKNLSVAELQMFLNRPDMCVCWMCEGWIAMINDEVPQEQSN